MITAAGLLNMELPISSERRFEMLGDVERAVTLIQQKVIEFGNTAGLDISSIQRGETPFLPSAGLFDYRFWGGGSSFDEGVVALNAGEPVTVVAVWLHGEIVGYGVARRGENGETMIEVIDVDARWRRSESNLKAKVMIEGEVFEVGVGHLVVWGLLKVCDPPLRVDATHEMSRYVFKSLGFRQDEAVENVCILVK